MHYGSPLLSLHEFCCVQRYNFLQDIQKNHVLQLKALKYLQYIILVQLNYLNLYKIKLGYIAYIIYSHHWKLGTQLLQFFTGKHKVILYIVLFVYILNCLLQTCLNLDVAIKCLQSRVKILLIFSFDVIILLVKVGYCLALISFYSLNFTLVLVHGAILSNIQGMQTQ